MKQVASLRYDVIFKKAFSHPELFTALVKDFLDIVLEIDEVISDKVFVPAVGKVATRFDLFAEDKKNRIIVEMQHAHYADTYERFVYYQSSAMVETITSSNNYHFPLTVITLVFLTGKKAPSSESSILVHDFEPRDIVSGKVLDQVYTHKHKLIFIFTKSVQKNTPENYREWMQAINDSLDKEVNDEDYTNSHIHDLFKVIETDQISPEERARMKDEYNRVESEKDAEKKGWQAGLKVGEEMGRLEGEEKIREAQNRLIETAQNFKSLGSLTDEQISSATGLSLDHVQAL